MKVKGMPMTAENGQRVFDRLKTQTRRIIKPQPEDDGHDGWMWRGGPALMRAGYGADYVHTSRDAMVRAMVKVAPYQPGDRVYIREPWRASNAYDDTPPSAIPVDEKIEYLGAQGPTGMLGRYRHARFMCQWMARSVCEIVQVRAERLNDISPEDCVAEGACSPIGTPRAYGVVTEAFAIERYRVLWESINGPGSWDRNDWVYAYTFRRLADHDH